MTRILGISDRGMNRILVVILVVVALLGGYFHAQLQTQKRKYAALQNKYSKLLEKQATESRQNQ